MKIKNSSFLLIKLFLIFFILIVSGLIGILVNINLFFIIVSMLIVVIIINIETSIEKNFLNFTNLFVVYWWFYSNSELILNYSNEKFLFDLNGKVYCLYFGAFFIYYITFKLTKIQKNTKIFFYDKNTLKLVIIMTFIMLSINLYYLFFVFGLNNYIFIPRTNRSLILKNTGLLYIASNKILFLLAPLAYIVFIRTNKLSAKILFVFVFLYNILFSLLSIDRSDLLQSVIPTLFIMLHFKRINKKLIYLLLIVGFFVLIDFKTFMSSLIIQGKINKINIYIPEEFFNSFRIAKDIMIRLKTSELNFLFGRSYFDALFATIFPFTEVEPLSLWYIRVYYPNIYYSGGGLGFSTIGEAYLNFGIIGVFIYYIFIGFIAKYLNKMKNFNDSYLIFYSLFITLSFKLFRSEFYSLVKTTVWFWVVPLIFVNLMVKIMKNIS